jgi:hypothetical protein
MDRNLSWGIEQLHKALAARSQQTGEARSIPGENTSPCEPSGGTIGQESDELTPRERFEDELRDTAEFNRF